MSDLYFAYGSNLKASRMHERIPTASRHGVASLHGMRVAVNKLSRDGSGKANLEREPGARVWGFVYRLEPEGWSLLDTYEPGYSRVRVELVGVSETRIKAQTYLADAPVDGLSAFDWYHTLIVEGAIEHGLPDDYIRELHALPVLS